LQSRISLFCHPKFQVCKPSTWSTAFFILTDCLIDELEEKRASLYAGVHSSLLYPVAQLQELAARIGL
jgi:hypothetical protein